MSPHGGTACRRFSLPLIPEETKSDNRQPSEPADPSLVMAEQSVRDVVNQSLSEGDISPSDVPASKSNEQAFGGDGEGAATRVGEDLHTDKTITLLQEQEKPDPVALGGEISQTIASTNGAGAASRATEPGTEPSRPGHGDTGVNGLTASDYAEELKHALGEASGGSDTDTSRADGKASEDDKHHIRTNSVKKPTSFKPVSFAKFSVSKTPGSATPVKGTSDKASSAASSSSSSLLTSRPRLVAKSTSGLRDSTPKGTQLGDKNVAGAPDPSQVWNKNRPTPTPSTKHLTDEELKQQYGIHMTSRLQADGEGKEAKWADIDDDEDDWAPETIEWNDGTKITLAQTDSSPQSGIDTKPIPVATVDTTEPPSARPLATTPTSSVGPNATILKLGANAERQQARMGLSSQKGPSERQSSGVKSPAPVPAKSPWAALPPVDRAPLLPSPPIPPPSRSHTKDSQGFAPSQMTMPSPAKEISADDFNRSWRESQPNQPKELYMPNSGRYEAVNEGRSRGARNEGGFRAPSLLQRPSATDNHAPAEPSAAFQTHRTSTQDGPLWSRRRTSSNVSGGSGQFARRMSVGRLSEAMPNDITQQRRGSQHSGQDRGDPSKTLPHSQQNYQKAPHQSRGVSPGQSPQILSPKLSYAPPGAPISPSMKHQHMAHQDVGVPTGSEEAPGMMEDPVLVQKRLMREKIELARQRKKEEEEREEAEKKERIRIRLEALTSAEKQDPAKEQSQPKISPPVVEPSKEVAIKAQSPPKPPVPEPTGAPKQYGLMKVHHPDTVKKQLNAKQADTPIDQLQKPSPPTMESRTEPVKPSAPPTTNGIRPSSESLLAHHSDTQPELSTTDTAPQPWDNNAAPPEPMMSWARSKGDHHAPVGGNLWGPPANGKGTLGNGTFERDLGGFSSREFPRGQFGQPDRPSVGQSWANERPPLSESPSAPFQTSNRSGNENLQSLPSFPPSAARSGDADTSRGTNRPAPIGPPQSQTSSAPWQASPGLRPDNRPELTAWNNFHITANKEEQLENERAQRELAARLEEERRTGIRRAPQQQPDHNLTWRQVEVGDQAGQRQVVGVTKTSVPSQASPAMHPFGAVGSIPPIEPNLRTVNGVAGGSRGGSRFFPHGPDGPTTQSRRAVTYSPGEAPRSPSPPPPEELLSHPAFSGDIHHPLVSLPAPKPTVKLPPAIVVPRPPPAAFASTVVSQPSYRPSSQPIAATASWQTRFDALTKGKSPPDRKTVPTVVSSSREPLDVLSAHSASVSLPQKSGELLQDAGKVTSKDVEDEEEMFEDREAGSLPLVKVPNDVPSAAWMPAPPPLTGPRFRGYITTIPPLPHEVFEELSPNHKELVFSIRLPGMASAKRKTIARKSPLHVNKNRNLSKNFNKGKGTKSKDGSTAHHGTKGHPPLPNGNTNSPKSNFSHGATWRTARPASGTAAS